MREKKKINFIDVVILICVALIILVAVFRGQITEYISGGKNLTSYSIAFESDPIGNSYVGYISTGNTVEWMEKGMEIGSIGSLETPIPSSVYTLGHDGKLIISESDSSKTVRGTLTVHALDNNGCFVSGTDFIGAGMKMTLKSNNAVFTVTVLSVTKN